MKIMVRCKKSRLYPVIIDGKLYECRNSTRIALVDKIKHDLTSNIKKCYADEPVNYYPYIITRTIYIKTIKIVETGFYNLIVEEIDKKIDKKYILYVKNKDNQSIVRRIISLDKNFDEKSNTAYDDLP